MKALGVCFFVFVLAACSAVSLDSSGRQALVDYQNKLSHCQDLGRDAGSYAVYETCTKEGGL